MKIMIRPAEGAFEYVMAHYAPPGLKPEQTDSYAVISIQDTHTGGFGFRFCENRYCRDVLTLYFDDIELPTEGLTLFSEEQASLILSFIRRNRFHVDTLLVHCYAGVNRSGAVAKFAAEYLNSPRQIARSVNMHVYRTLMAAWETRKKQAAVRDTNGVK